MGDVGCGDGLLGSALPATFMTPLVRRIARAAFLIPCLLICLACATPFPIENLEMGMTTREVRESVGEPRFNHRDQTWIYTHEEWRSRWFLPPSPFFFAGLISIPVNAVWPNTSWDAQYVVEKEAFLHFEEGLLIGWQVDGLGRQGVEESIVAIKLKIGGLDGWLSGLLNPPVIFFARLEADGQKRQGDLLRSNYQSGGYAYLVNANPGRYSAIGVRHDYYNADTDYCYTHTFDSSPTSPCYSGSTYWFFPGSMIEETIVTAEPSGMAFMGEFEISGNLKFDGSDDMQRRYSDMLSVSEYAHDNPIVKAFERPPVTSVKFVADYRKDQSEMATQRFLKSSQSLAELGWRASTTQASEEDGDDKEISEQPDK